MKNGNIIEGFSGLTRKEKIKLLTSLTKEKEGFKEDLNSHLHSNSDYQKLYNGLSENSLSNYFLPYSIAPNFLINHTYYFVPMVTDESSVVAAASAGAKFWAKHGGFRSKVLSTIKTGQIHFTWMGEFEKLQQYFRAIKEELLAAVEPITKKMQQRGGGITGMELLDKTADISDYYQIQVKFDTRESMGANFINSVLEEIADVFREKLLKAEGFSMEERNVDTIMAILSNYSPECIVETSVECLVESLSSGIKTLPSEQFARKFKLAVDIANSDIHRAVTNNKGIFNGIDAVAIATGNDFRAIEAQGHAWASRDGHYRGLTEVHIQDGFFRMMLKIPLSVGTIGGVTRLHPLAKRSLELLGNPGANELMQIMSAVGLANHFSAIKSLITTGIQSGHMRLHLSNILTGLMASGKEKTMALKYFRNKQISYKQVENFLKQIRKSN